MIIDSMLNPNIDPTNFDLFKFGKEGHERDSQGRYGRFPVAKNDKCPLWDHPFGVPSGIVICPQRDNNRGATAQGVGGGKGFLETGYSAKRRWQRMLPSKKETPMWGHNGGYLCALVLDDRKVGFAYSDTGQRVQLDYENPIYVTNSEGQLFKYHLNPEPVAGPRATIDDTNPQFQGGKVFQLADGEPDFDSSLTRWKDKIAFFDNLPNAESSNWKDAALSRAWAFAVANNGGKAFLTKFTLTSEMQTALQNTKNMSPCTEISSSSYYFSGDSHSMYFVYHATEGWCFYGFGQGATATSLFTASGSISWAQEDSSLVVPNDTANRIEFSYSDFDVSAKITTGKELNLAKPHVGVVRPAVTATNGGVVSSTPKKVDIPIYYKDNDTAEWTLNEGSIERQSEFTSLDVFPGTIKFDGWAIPLGGNTISKQGWAPANETELRSLLGGNFEGWEFKRTVNVKNGGSTVGTLEATRVLFRPSTGGETELVFDSSDYGCWTDIGTAKSNDFDSVLSPGDTVAYEITYEDVFGRTQTITTAEDIPVGTYALPTGASLGPGISATTFLEGDTASFTYSITTLGFPAGDRVEVVWTLSGTQYVVECDQAVVAGASNATLTFTLPVDIPSGLTSAEVRGIEGSGTLRTGLGTTFFVNV